MITIDQTLERQIDLIDFLQKETRIQLCEAGLTLSPMQEFDLLEGIVKENYPNCLRKKIMSEVSQRSQDLIKPVHQNGEQLPPGRPNLPGEAK